MKNRKGITLIALIITIIVMLILAAVVIGIAIGNNGVLEQSQTATKEMNEATLAEKIYMSSEYGMDGYLKTGKTAKNAKENLEAEYGTVTLNPPNPSDDYTGDVEITVNGKKFKILSSGITQLTPDIEPEGLKIGDTITSTQLEEKYNIERTDTGVSGGIYSGDWMVIAKNENHYKLVSKQMIQLEVDVDADTAWSEEIEDPTKDILNDFNDDAYECTGIENARMIKLEDIYDVIEKNVGEEVIDPYKIKYSYNSSEGDIECQTQEASATGWGQKKSTGYEEMKFILNDLKTRKTLNSSNLEEVILTNNAFSYNFNETDLNKLGFLANNNYPLASIYFKARYKKYWCDRRSHWCILY